MAVYKCKMCGGDLNPTEGATVCECDFCGTNQTVPSPTDDNIKTLYNRANNLRLRAEFDKAEQIYEKIVETVDTEAEAYWGLVLCEYGIEYVEDPETFKMVPTCHRASFDSVQTNENYRLAVENADPLQRAIYESEAKEIDRLQKEIIEISGKEEPYDVFICYKETDENGKRTQDSVIANDIYYQLTDEGFKVFYAAVTLENKLGSAYESHIFAALNTAKVMLVIGTKPEYFNAPWVRNEWSRFFKIVKADRSKLLIPCYRDMDAYDLPKEFAHLQAQDMSQIGFINNVIRGIKRVIVVDEEPKPTAVREPAVQSTVAGVEPLLKRAYISLEDRDFAKADDFCEQVLNIDPECAKAYFIKFLAEYRISREEDIVKTAADLNDFPNFKKALRYADPEMTKRLKRLEEDARDYRNQKAYNEAVRMMKSGDLDEILEATEIFNELAGYGYKDSAALFDKCEELENNMRNEAEYQKAVELMGSGRYVENYIRAEEILKAISGYKDSAILIEKCRAAVCEIEESRIKKLVERIDEVFTLINERHFDKAAELVKEIEAYSPNNERLEIAKLLINYKVKNEDQLAKQPPHKGSLSYNDYYRKLLEIGSPNTVAKYKTIAEDMVRAKKRWKPIGWILGILFIAACAAVFYFKLSFGLRVGIGAAVSIIYAILTRVLGNGNKYGPGDYYLSFSFVSIVTDIVAAIVFGNQSFFGFIGYKVIHAAACFVGFFMLDFENYDDNYNKGKK